MKKLEEQLARRTESREPARLTMVVFHHKHPVLKTWFLLELLVARRVVLGFGGVLQIQGYSPSPLGHPMSELELCRRDGSDYIHDCTRGGAMDVPNAEYTMSSSTESKQDMCERCYV